MSSRASVRLFFEYGVGYYRFRLGYLPPPPNELSLVGFRDYVWVDPDVDDREINVDLSR